MRKVGNMRGLVIDDELTIGSSLTVALQESETRYRVLSDNIRDVIWAGDLNLRHIYVSPSIIGLTGYSVEEFMSKQMDEILTPASFEMAKKALAEELAAQNTGQNDLPESRTRELQMNCKDGSTVWTQAKMTLLYAHDGHPVGVLGVVWDITERKRAEEELRESEEKLHTMFESIRDGIFVIDLEGHIVEANKATLHMTGYDKQHLIGRSAFELISPDDRARAMEQMRQTLEKGPTREMYTYTVLAADGREVDAEFFGDLICDPQGNPTGFIGVMRDITERKRAEELVNLLSTAVRTSADAISVASPVDGRLVFCNEAFQRQWKIDGGYHDIHWIDCFDRDSQRDVLREVAKATSAGGWSGELLARSTDSQTFPVLVTSCPVVDKEGRILGLLGIFRDIAERKRAEEALRQTERKYKELAESITDVFFAFDEELRYIYWNRASEELTGVSAEDAVGKHLYDLFPDSEATRRAERVYRKALGTKKPQYFVNEYQLNGKEFVFEISAYPAESGLSVFVKDVTERKRVEEEIRESERRYRLLAENVTDVIWKVNMDSPTRLNYISPSVTQLLGYTVEEAMNKPMEEVFTPTSFENAMRALAEEMACIGEEPVDQHRSRTLELELRRKDGSLVVVEANHTIIRDTDGQPIEILTVARDITMRKQAEHKYQVIIRTAMDGFWLADMQGHFLDVNEAYCHLTGYSRDELLNMAFSDVEAVEKAEEIAKHIQKIEEVGYDSFESHHRRKDGRIIDVEISVNYLPIENGLMFVFSRDISERKRAEDEKELMSAQLLQAQKMESIGTLAGGIAHDFNNVITAIQGYTEVAMMEVDEADPLHKYLKGIDAACSNAARLTSQLLLFGRKNPMQAVPVNINEVVQNVQQILKRLLREDIAIEAHLEPDIFTIEADPGNIEQVIMNLAVNARDAMSEGGKLTITTENVILSKKQCKAVPEARPGSYVCLSVADTGTGIDKEIIPHIFEPFFSTKEAEKGSGLGLAVIYGIVKAHNGWIDVHSEPGQGSTFKLYLPAVPGSPEGKDDETMSPEQIRGNGERILLVEDDRGVREFVNEALSENGYVVFEAVSARDALKVFDSRKGDFHLAFIDIVLPDMSGLELVDQIHSRSPELPVLLGSGYLHDKLEWPVIHERRCQVLQKPYALGGVMRAVRATIGAAQG